MDRIVPYPVGGTPPQPPKGGAPQGWQDSNVVVTAARVIIGAAALLGTFQAWPPFRVPDSPPNAVANWQTVNPEVTKAPLSAAQQQYEAHTEFSVPTATTPHGWESLQPPERFTTPFPAPAQQFNSFEPAGFIASTFPDGWEGQQWEFKYKQPFPVALQQYVTHLDEQVATAATPEGWYPQPPDVFKQPLAASLQQYVAHLNYQVPSKVTPHGWEGQQLEYRFAKPFAPGGQQFQTFTRGAIPVRGVAGWHPQPPDVFAKPFPVAQQLFLTWDPQVITNTINYAFYPQPPEVFKRPFAVTEQIFSPAPEPEQFLPGFGWWGFQLDYRFAKPFPVEQQLFSVVQLVGDVPLFRPPGAGKYPLLPSYIPQPPYSAKANKPYRPVWDKPREGEIEQHPTPPVGPPPLPPASLFAQGPSAPTNASLNLGALPTFNHLVPQDMDGYGRRIREAQDISDAIAVLKSLGLLGDDQG